LSWTEYEKWKQGSESAPMYRHLLEDATTKAGARREAKKIVRPAEFPWENSPHGLLKHLVNEEMDTRCDTVDAYMQIIPPGSKSGKHRQLAEQAVTSSKAVATISTSTAISRSVDGEKYSWRPEGESSASTGSRRRRLHPAQHDQPALQNARTPTGLR